MNITQIRQHLLKGENVLLYKRDVTIYYSQLKDEFPCILLGEPLPLKYKLIKCIQGISGDEFSTLEKMNIIQLRDTLSSKIKDNKILIIFNQFDRLTRKSAEVYHSLQQNGKVIYLCSFQASFKQEVYSFYQSFHLLNKNEYQNETGKNDINISYAVYAILGILCCLVYLKISNASAASGILIGALWFAVIIFRTLIFVGGRI
ncbi:MAG: hypothetical protein QME14_03970 [Methanobacteriaceae archaeon]|nr:hypothetical protein [Methanobacteriaceae archaeon]